MREVLKSEGKWVVEKKVNEEERKRGKGKKPKKGGLKKR